MSKKQDKYPEDYIPNAPSQSDFLWWWWNHISIMVINYGLFIWVIIGAAAGFMYPNLIISSIAYIAGWRGEKESSHMGGIREEVGVFIASLAFGYLLGNLISLFF